MTILSLFMGILYVEKIVFKIVSWPSYLYLWESYTWKKLYLRLSHDHLIFIYGNPIPGKSVFSIETWPCQQITKQWFPGSFWVLAQAMGGSFTQRCLLLLAEPIPRMIPGSFLQYWPLYREIHPRTKGWQFADGISWWRHIMETFSALLALCAGNSPVPVNSPHKGQWRRALMFSLIWVWINNSVNNWEAGDLIRHGGHYDVNVMLKYICLIVNVWISNDTSVKFVSRGLIAHKFRLVQVMAWHWRGDKPNKPLPNPMTWIILDISWSLIFWAWLV